MRLNVGCGNKHIPGWTSVDAVALPGRTRPDIIADCRSIPLSDGCADELMAIHLFEHLYLWEAEQALKEWHRLLKPGGALVLEMPDIIKSARNLLELTAQGSDKVDQLAMWGIYGDPRPKDHLMCHHWGWTFKTIAPVLGRNGFRDMVEKRTVFHAVGIGVRDFRIEAVKS